MKSAADMIVHSSRRHLAERFDDLAALLHKSVVILLPGYCDPLQHFLERWLTVSVFGRKISPAQEGLQIGRQPNAHWPAAAARCGLNKRHVNTVYVGSLLAIDLDVDELAIHGCRYLFAFE